MAIERSDSQQTTCSATAMVNGERRQVASATCSIRPGRAINISIDLMEGMEPTAEELAEIKEMFTGYIAGEVKKAAGLGIPVALPGK